MRGFVPALLIIPCLALASPAQPYLLLGIDALVSGERAAAERFLGAAAELDPAGSDAPYYLSRLYVQSDVSRSIALLERAVKNARFEKAASHAARLDLAALLVRVGRHEQALKVLEGLAPADSRTVDPFRLTAAALLGLGRQEAALSAIEAGLRRHPADAALHLLRARALRAAGRPVKEALDLAAMVVPDDPAVAAERALAAIAEGGFTLEAYSAKSAADAPVFAQAFAAKPDATTLDRFFEAGGNLQVDLLVAVEAAAARDQRLKTRFDEATAGFTGRRWVDENRDTVAEEIYEYERGALVSWTLDSDQDLRADVRYDGDVLLADGMRFEYAPYPYLSRARLLREGVTWVFDLPPRRLQGPFVEGVDRAGVARLRLLGNIPREATLAMASRAVSSISATGARRTWTLEAGAPSGYEEDANADGRCEYVVTYRGGRPFAGQRDLDGDGAFDVSESWSARGLARIEVDLNHNGIADYTVDFERRLWLWDYDEDGAAERTVRSDETGPSPASLWPAIVAAKGERP